MKTTKMLAASRCVHLSFRTKLHPVAIHAIKIFKMVVTWETAYISVELTAQFSLACLHSIVS